MLEVLTPVTETPLAPGLPTKPILPKQTIAATFNICLNGKPCGKLMFDEHNLLKRGCVKPLRKQIRKMDVDITKRMVDQAVLTIMGRFTKDDFCTGGFDVQGRRFSFQETSLEELKRTA